MSVVMVDFGSVFRAIDEGRYEPVVDRFTAGMDDCRHFCCEHYFAGAREYEAGRNTIRNWQQKFSSPASVAACWCYINGWLDRQLSRTIIREKHEYMTEKRGIKPCKCKPPAKPKPPHAPGGLRVTVVP